jgi:hypothetical protein
MKMKPTARSWLGELRVIIHAAFQFVLSAVWAA